MIFACDSRATRGIKGPSGVTAQGGPPTTKPMGQPEARRSPCPGLTDLSPHGVRNRPEEGARHREMARPATAGQPPIRCPDLGDAFLSHPALRDPQERSWDRCRPSRFFDVGAARRLGRTRRLCGLSSVAGLGPGPERHRVDIGCGLGSDQSRRPLSGSRSSRGTHDGTPGDGASKLSWWSARAGRYIASASRGLASTSARAPIRNSPEARRTRSRAGGAGLGTRSTQRHGGAVSRTARANAVGVAAEYGPSRSRNP